MAEYPDLTLTNAALNMIAESQATQTSLIFTKAKVGDGDLSPTASIQDMTDLISSKLEAPYSSSTNEGNGHLLVKFAISNAGLENGFFAKEIGIFAKLEGGAETLYAYSNAGAKCDWIPNKNVPIDSQVIESDIIIGNAANVSVVVHDNAYALAKDLITLEEIVDNIKSGTIKVASAVNADYAIEAETAVDLSIVDGMLCVTYEEV